MRSKILIYIVRRIVGMQLNLTNAEAARASHRPAHRRSPALRTRPPRRGHPAPLRVMLQQNFRSAATRKSRGESFLSVV